MTEQQADYTTDTSDALEMLGKGYERTRVKDESNDKKYFIITPRIVKAYARNSHDFSLWDTIKDVAGESGECYLNTEQLAILSGISTGQVSNSRKYWIKIGFLKGEIRKDPGFTQAVWHLSIPDLWAKNIEWCEQHLKIADRIAFRKAHRSLHRVKPSYSEGMPSPSETKKKELKKNKGAPLSIENKIFADQPITQSDLDESKINDQAPKVFERIFVFGTLPWSSNTMWTKFQKFITQIYTRDPGVFADYVSWRNGDGKYKAFSNRKIRENPAAFMDTGYPEFEASKMYAASAPAGGMKRHKL